jgi:hypothetical protein
MPPTERLLTLPTGLHLHILEAGPTDGPLCVLLHGFPESSYAWRHQIGPLAAAGLRVVAPDQRGYGRSDKPRGIGSYRMDRLAGGERRRPTRSRRDRRRRLRGRRRRRADEAVATNRSGPATSAAPTLPVYPPGPGRESRGARFEVCLFFSSFRGVAVLWQRGRGGPGHSRWAQPSRPWGGHRRPSARRA